MAQGHWLTAAAPGVTDREREWGQALVAHWAVETEMEVIRSFAKISQCLLHPFSENDNCIYRSKVHHEDVIDLENGKSVICNKGSD